MKNQIKVIILLLIALIVQSCSSEKIKNDLGKDNLNGKVSSYLQKEYKAYDRFGVVTRVSTDKVGYDFQYKYDEHGNRIEMNLFDFKGNILRLVLIDCKL